jgi:hypothetical protein
MCTVYVLVSFDIIILSFKTYTQTNKINKMPTQTYNNNGKKGYNVIGAGKIWHWAPGPGESWSDDVAEFWPDSKDYQTLIRHERALQNATVTPMDLAADEFMDAQVCCCFSPSHQRSINQSICVFYYLSPLSMIPLLVSLL